MIAHFLLIEELMMTLIWEFYEKRTKNKAKKSFLWLFMKEIKTETH